jgi:DNA uptake protein ComE-like DNA-binding protein
MEPPKKPSRLPLIFAAVALIFLLSALIIQQTVKGNRERVEIIENETRVTATATKPVTAAGNGNGSKPKDVTGVSQTGIVTVIDVSDNVLGESTGQISVNDAIFEELDAIPGVGPKTAEKIINGRPWTSLDEALNLISKRYRDEARGKLKL